MSTLTARHVAAQRRYAAKLRAMKAPRSDDIGRAFVAATRSCLAGGVPEAHKPVWAQLVLATADQLVARGFDRAEARRRLKRALMPHG